MSDVKECWSVDEENFKYGSLGDLLDEHDDIEVGATIYVGDAIEPNIAHLCDDDDVIDIIRDRAYDIGGDYAEDCAEVSNEARAELKALLRGWIEKHCNLNFYAVENVRPYKLSHDDFPHDSTPVEAGFIEPIAAAHAAHDQKGGGNA